MKLGSNTLSVRRVSAEPYLFTRHLRSPNHFGESLSNRDRFSHRATNMSRAERHHEQLTMIFLLGPTDTGRCCAVPSPAVKLVMTRNTHARAEEATQIDDLGRGLEGEGDFMAFCRTRPRQTAGLR